MHTGLETAALKLLLQVLGDAVPVGWAGLNAVVDEREAAAGGDLDAVSLALTGDQVLGALDEERNAAIKGRAWGGESLWLSGVGRALWLEDLDESDIVGDLVLVASSILTASSVLATSSVLAASSVLVASSVLTAVLIVLVVGAQAAQTVGAVDLVDFDVGDDGGILPDLLEGRGLSGALAHGRHIADQADQHDELSDHF